MSKKGLSDYRMKVFNLLQKRSKFVDARSYNFYVNKIFSAQKKKLDDIYTALKAVKKIPDAIINKKSFDNILQQAQDMNKEYKVTVYAQVKYNFLKGKKEYKDPKIEREPIDMFTIKGKSSKDVKRKIKNMIDDKYEDYVEFLNPDTLRHIKKTIQSVEYEKSAVPKHAIPLNKIPMKQAYTLHRDWLKYAEGIDTKAYDDMKGQCVYELLSAHLSNPSKRINVTKDKLFDIFNDFYKSQHGVSDLDYGVSDVFEGNFTMDSGVTTEMIKHLCEQRKISLYAFDVKQNCFEKVIHSHTSNYRPIVYYLIDGHMYLITNKDVIKSVTSAEKVNKNVIVSSLLEMDDDNVTNDVIECETFADALAYEEGFIILPVTNITDDVHEYIRNTKNVPQLKVEHHHIVRMTIVNNKKRLTIMSDPNILDGYTWKDIKAICDKANIPFKNQRIGGLISALRKKFFKPERRVLTADEKANLVKEQSNKCMICQEETKEFEYDHIQSLANGGSNDLDNFQALCKPCHLQKTNEERDNSDFIKYDDVASTFNDKALEIIRSQHFKQWAFIEKLYEGEISMDNVHKIDHAKCRRNLLMQSQHDFPMYSVMDYPTVYDGKKIQCGYYFVETDNYFPFRGNGWYNYTMVMYAKMQNIPITITHQFIPSFTIKNDHFKGFAEHLLKLTEGSNLGKLIINSFVGCWGIQSTKMEHIQMTTNKYEASRELCREGVFVKSNKLDEKVTLYSIIDQLIVNKDDMFLPLYNQIVAMEAIELHRLENIIVAQGGVPLERNTDAILYRGAELDISSYYWDDDKTIFKYRYDETVALHRDAVCRMNREGSFKPASFIYKQFKEQDDFQAIANDVLASGKGCLVTGVAGTGKTYFANMLIDTLQKAGKRCDVKLAPTNKAASHIQGQTIHKYYLSLFLSNNYEKKLLKSLNNMDYIIVDEISMVKEVFYRFFILVKRYVPKINFIIIGDFAQFKPVNDIYTGSYKDSPALHHLCDGQQINLTKCRRADDELFNLYTNIPSVDASRFEYKGLTDLNIAYTHNTRKRVNRMCMDKFSEGKEYMLAQPSRLNKKTQTTRIFVGLPIVAHRNSKEMEIFNSEVFEISDVNFNDKTFTFVNGETLTQSRLRPSIAGAMTEHTMHINQFSSMFYPAFCITAHVSQGCTFDKPYTIWDWNHPRMDETAKYVALSRATSIKNIQINI